jgi:hypothetical protein
MADVVARGTDMAYQGAISPNGEEDAVGVEE